MFGFLHEKEECEWKWKDELEEGNKKVKMCHSFLEVNVFHPWGNYFPPFWKTIIYPLQGKERKIEKSFLCTKNLFVLWFLHFLCKVVPLLMCRFLFILYKLLLEEVNMQIFVLIGKYKSIRINALYCSCF